MPPESELVHRGGQVLDVSQPTDANLPDLRPVAGLRALACLGIISTHVVYWTCLAAADRHQVYDWLHASPLTMFLLSIGEPAMDAFLVLSGFLAAATLLPTLETTANAPQAVLRYYRKRLVRIVPNLYSVLLLTLLVVLPLGASRWLNDEARRAFFSEVPWDVAQCPHRLWAAFAFVNNTLPMGGCASTTWSLAVTMQFYAAAPLLLLALRPRAPRFRRAPASPSEAFAAFTLAQLAAHTWARVAAVAGLALGTALAQRARLALRLRLWERMPVALFGPHDDPATRATLDAISQTTYLSTVNRGGALALGVLAALVVYTPAARAVLLRWRRAVVITLCVLGAVLLGSQVEPRAGALPDPSHKLAQPVPAVAGFVVLAGLVQPLVAALLLALATARLPGPAAGLGRALAAPPLARLADLSYDVYLLHPLVILALFAVAPPSLWYSPDRAPALIGALALVTAATAALAHWHGRLWQRVTARLTGPASDAPRKGGAAAKAQRANGLNPTTAGGAPSHGKPPLCPHPST